MKNHKIKKASFSNRKKELKVEYSNGKEVTLHYGQFGLKKNIERIWVDSETRGRSIGMELEDGKIDFMPYDEPLALIKDPDFVLQNQVETLIAKIHEELRQKNMSKKFLARKLGTSDNQIERLLNPNLVNKNLSQLCHIASILDLNFEIQVKSA